MATKNQNLGELLPIKENNGQRAVNARDLHSFLGSKQQFTDWMNNRIKKYGFIENKDYEVFHNVMKNPEGGRPSDEYALSIGMAKELSMVENTARGREARLYFIACEEKAKSLAPAPVLPQTYIEALKALIAAEEEKQQLQLANQSMKPKAEYFDSLVERNLLTNFRDTAKQLHIPQNTLIELLITNRYIYRDKKGTLKPYSEYTPEYFEMKDFSYNGHAGVQTLVTPKGKEAFRLMWGGGQYAN